jgi:hypothetical protein
MAKYTRTEILTMMADRGWQTSAVGWSKLISQSDDRDPGCWLFAEQTSEDRIRLTSGPMKMLITISTEPILIDHPRFADFEQKMTDYINTCVDFDAVQDHMRRRTEDREKSKK